MSDNERATGLLKELEDKYGGKITDRTYALSVYLPNHKPLEHGVFLFRIGDTFYYEDFEPSDVNILGFKIKKKNPEVYVKTEGSFRKESVKDVVKVSKSYARGYHTKKALGKINGIKKAGAITRFFRESTYAIVLDNDDVLFFEQIKDIVGECK